MRSRDSRGQGVRVGAKTTGLKISFSDLKSCSFAEKLKNRMDSALVDAAADGDASMVEILLSQGARVDAREQGFTPLLVAAQYGNFEVGVSTLLCDISLLSGW